MLNNYINSYIFFSKQFIDRIDQDLSHDITGKFTEARADLTPLTSLESMEMMGLGIVYLLLLLFFCFFFCPMNSDIFTKVASWWRVSSWHVASIILFFFFFFFFLEPYVPVKNEW